jgi:hypothetical protein
MMQNTDVQGLQSKAEACLAPLKEPTASSRHRSTHAILGCAVAGMAISMVPRMVLKTFRDAKLLSSPTTDLMETMMCPVDEQDFPVDPRQLTPQDWQSLRSIATSRKPRRSASMSSKSPPAS